MTYKQFIMMIQCKKGTHELFISKLYTVTLRCDYTKVEDDSPSHREDMYLTCRKFNNTPHYSLSDNL